MKTRFVLERRENLAYDLYLSRLINEARILRTLAFRMTLLAAALPLAKGIIVILDQ